MHLVGYGEGGVLCELLKPKETVTAKRYQQRLERLNDNLMEKKAVSSIKSPEGDSVARQCSAARYIGGEKVTDGTGMAGFSLTQCILQTLPQVIITCSG